MLLRRPQEERNAIMGGKAEEEGRRRDERTVYGSVRGRVDMCVRRWGVKEGHEKITWLRETGAEVEQKGQGDGGYDS